MIVHTSKNSYLVIGYVDQEIKKELSLCENIESHRRYLMVRFRDPDLIRSCVGFFYEQAENRDFTDFEECAVDGEDLLVFFAYPKGQPLEKKLSAEYMGMEERLAIVKNILEKWILQDMPAYFAARSLRIGGIWVERSLAVTFLYDITGAERGMEFGMAEVSASLYNLLDRMFSEELKKETVPELKKFRKELQENIFSDYVQLYRRFQEVQTALMNLSEESLVMPKTWIFRVWDRVKKTIRPFKKLVAWMLLVAALVYMMWTIRTSSNPAASMEVLEQIGTLDIR